MTYWLQPIILWAALPLAILLVVATVDTMVAAIKTAEQGYDRK
jgi:hypothetical protein